MGDDRRLLRGRQGMGSQGVDSSTLFLRNLGPGTEEGMLRQWVTSRVGPVRRVVVVTEKGAGESRRCKGFAFVQFAVAEDVQRAAELLNGQEWMGRKVRVDTARRRMRRGGRRAESVVGGTDGEDDENEEGDDDQGNKKGGETDDIDLGQGQLVSAVGNPEDSGRQGKDHARTIPARPAPAKRTVLVTLVWDEGASQSGSEAAQDLLERIRRWWDTQQCAFSVDPNGQLRFVFNELKHVRDALTKLHGLRLDRQCLCSARIEALGASRRGRVIIRNLSFQETERGLHQRFSHFGPIQEFSIPRDDRGRLRGFAFIQYFLPEDAKSAVAGLNGTSIHGRTVAVDLALAKNLYIDATKSGGRERALLAPEEVGDGESPEREASHSMSTPEELARTIFVRNILYETTAPDLRRAMAGIGPVEQCVLVLDPVLHRSKGTAFVRFRTHATAAALLKRAGPEGLGAGIMLGGRTLRISPAVDKDHAEEFKPNARKDRNDTDPRNLSLAETGFLLQDSQDAKAMAPEDLDKRMRAQKQMREKLQKNPNTFVSPTRLSIRNLPKEVDDATLKTIFRNATGSASAIVQAKIVRNEEKRGGEARSKGYGFVEFKDHEAAAAALDKVNNHPSLFSTFLPTVSTLRQHDGRRPIVSFAIEDKRKLRILELAKQRRASKRASSQSNEAASTAPRPSELDRKRRGNVERPSPSSEVEIGQDSGGPLNEALDTSRPGKKPRRMAESKVNGAKGRKRTSNGSVKLALTKAGEWEKPAGLTRSKPRKHRRIDPEDVRFESLLREYRIQKLGG